MKSKIFIRLKDHTKHRFVGTQYEWESHINNIFRILDRNLKTYTPNNMLDVGCGDGDRTIRIADYFNINVKNILGIDYSDELVVACRSKFQATKIDLETDGIPSKENKFDLVICNQVLEHLKNYKKVIDNLIKVTRKGGYIVIGIPNLAHLINRIYLLFGIQPMCINLDSSHVRGFTHRGFRNQLVSFRNVKLIDYTGALIYPFPFFITEHVADYLVGLTGYICYLLKKIQ